ncbi:DUF5979 domain-containing protein [Flaviflexus massiliensis]|uniref:DUF5979 domain-containing protein n=1 Tax=Flaviflexus massiliensis TaxID=1522309 RepID=UPI0006D53EC8|nr:DUF5979 domain-containing protein [Flaviflexus massiliensis]
MTLVVVFAAQAFATGADDVVDPSSTSPTDESVASAGNDEEPSEIADSQSGGDAASTNPETEPSDAVSEAPALIQQRKVETEPMCEPGYSFGFGRSGQLQQVAPDGQITNLGRPASSGTDFNGLGIGTEGHIYSILRSSDTSGTSRNARVYSYDVNSGTWSSTGASTANLNGQRNTETNLVAGAVDLSSNLYYFGGYTSNGNFKVYEYNPSASTKLRLKGTVSTNGGSSSNGGSPLNGDMAFDGAGNLYILRGVNNNVTIFSVTAENFRQANGGKIPASQSASFRAMDSVNGLAFDSDGKAYVSSNNEVRSYDMPGWENGKTVTSNLVNSGDLASCSSPPTITIEKYIDGERVSSTDQFTLTLRQGSRTIGTATTEGKASGIQSERVGPLPTVRGVPLTFSESISSGGNLSNYASSYRCFVDGVLDSSASGNGTSGRITIPYGADSVLCSFYNKPLVADITIEKRVADSLGENPAPAGGWDLTTKLKSSTSGRATLVGTETQKSSSQGHASWSVRFTSNSDRATISVSELQQPGFEFDSGQCVITHLDGSTNNVVLTSEAAKDLTGIAPGDSINCTYVNAPKPGVLTIDNLFDESVPNGSGNIPFSGAYACVLNEQTVASGTWTVNGEGGATLVADEGSRSPDRIPAGSECSITHAPEGGTSDGLPDKSYTWKPGVAGPAVTIASGTTSNLTVTNAVDRVYGAFAIREVLPTHGFPESSGGVVEGTWTCTAGNETITGSWGPLARGEVWSSEGQQIPLGATCEVEAKRIANPGNGYEWDGAPKVTAPVSATDLADLSDATIVVSNEVRILPGTVSWSKVDPDGNRLSNSEWTLTGPTQFNNGQPLTILDCYAGATELCAQTTDTNTNSGEFTITNLPWGDYTLTEAKAPAGYYKLSNPITFKIGASELVIDLVAIPNTPMASPELPLTGGISRDHYTITGMLLAAVGATFLWRTRRRTARRS